MAAHVGHFHVPVLPLWAKSGRQPSVFYHVIETAGIVSNGNCQLCEVLHHCGHSGVRGFPLAGALDIHDLLLGDLGNLVLLRELSVARFHLGFGREGFAKFWESSLVTTSSVPMIDVPALRLKRCDLVVQEGGPGDGCLEF